MKKSYGPPGAPWVDEDEASVFPLVLRRTADVLADQLESRLRMLKRADVTADQVMLEIRRQIAACAIDEPMGAGLLSELLLELLTAKENARCDL